MIKEEDSIEQLIQVSQDVLGAEDSEVDSLKRRYGKARFEQGYNNHWRNEKEKDHRSQNDPICASLGMLLR
ncbi:MAG: hypothetical protein V5A88_08825 [Candidatus Thermoplasmatota archaeon]